MRFLGLLLLGFLYLANYCESFLEGEEKKGGKKGGKKRGQVDCDQCDPEVLCLQVGSAASAPMSATRRA
jgi:hypothetical protein